MGRNLYICHKAGLNKRLRFTKGRKETRTEASFRERASTKSCAPAAQRELSDFKQTLSYLLVYVRKQSKAERVVFLGSPCQVVKSKRSFRSGLGPHNSRCLQLRLA